MKERVLQDEGKVLQIEGKVLQIEWGLSERD